MNEPQTDAPQPVGLITAGYFNGFWPAAKGLDHGSCWRSCRPSRVLEKK